jgi:hypothetical protein
MSSLQKFHRRTQAVGPKTYPTVAIGSGNDTIGYCLGATPGKLANLYVAPKSSEVYGYKWANANTTTNTISTTDGLSNTNTLNSTAYPAVYYCKNLTTGGYNTWYMPARDELTIMYSNKSATPFATANQFGNSPAGGHWSSTENNTNTVYARDMTSGAEYGNYTKSTVTWAYARAIRRGL